MYINTDTITCNETALHADLETMLNLFQVYLKEHNMASNTITAYLFGVRQFYSRHDTLNSDTLSLYKVALMDRYMPQTVNMRIRALNCFLKFLGIQGFGARPVRLQKKCYTDHVISQADYEYLKRRLWEDEQYTFYFIVRLTAATGVRVSELVAFDVDDVFQGFRDICSKGSRVRRVFIPTVLQKKMTDWLAGEQRSFGPLFLSHLRQRISISGVRAQLKTYALRYHLDPKMVYPHSFRHRFAKNFIENGGDLSLLSRLLGHSSIETTRIYLRRTSTEQAEIFNQVVDW